MEIKLEACAWIGTYEGLDLRIDRVFDGEQYVYRSFASRFEKDFQGNKLGTSDSAHSGPCESYDEAFAKLGSCILRVTGKEVERRGRWTRRQFSTDESYRERWVLDGGGVILHKRQNRDREFFSWVHVASHASGVENTWEAATALAEALDERLAGLFPPTVWTPHVAP